MLCAYILDNMGLTSPRTRGSTKSVSGSPGTPVGKDGGKTGGTGAAVGGTVKSTAAVGGTGVKELTFRQLCLVSYVVMLCAVTMNQGDKWKFPATTGVFFAAVGFTYFVDEADPDNKTKVFAAWMFASTSMYAFNMIPYFESDEQFMEKFFQGLAEINGIYKYVVSQLEEVYNNTPFSGINKKIFEYRDFGKHVFAIYKKQ